MNIIAMAEEAGLAFSFDGYPDIWANYTNVGRKEIEAFAALVEAAARADERERVTEMLNYLNMKAQPYHNYYRHAAVEINRKEGEGEKI